MLNKVGNTLPTTIRVQAEIADYAEMAGYDFIWPSGGLLRMG